MKCKDFRYDFVDYVKGMISSDKKKEIDNHLQVCENCRKEIEEIKNVSSALDSFKITEPDESFFINFVPNLNEKIANRKTKSNYKKALNFALSFSTVFSVIILMFILMQVGHQNITTEQPVVSEVQVETPKIEEIEPTVTSYENYVQDNLVIKIKNKEKIEKKATEELASAVLAAQSDIIFSRDNIASFVDNLSDEEVDNVIEKLKTKDILQ
jgi:hypothetical protein